ncbi:signal transducer and transcription activator-like [Watersipora subatra]|uniref:signal transducer and transcription activator-like n=1 Tax=Watersipora subatra TaxID=2589382 RepID=UPI00355C3CEF
MKSVFTFWEWLFSIQKVIKDSLRELWNQGLIMGFISKKAAHGLLSGKPPGTFLFRFSETELGGVSVVYSCADHASNSRPVYVCNLAPLTDKELRIRSLANRVKDINELTYLYPDIPKERAFGAYWSPDPEVLTLPPHPDEYIKHTLSMRIPGMPASSPNTDILSSQTPTSSSMATSLMDYGLSS